MKTLPVVVVWCFWGLFVLQILSLCWTLLPFPASKPQTHLEISLDRAEIREPCANCSCQRESNLFFSSVWLHRRRNWWGRAVVFTSGVTDSVTACKPRMALLWRGQQCSPRPLQWPCMMEKCLVSALWTGPNGSTPFLELSFPWAFSFLTSFTGWHTKCCDTKTSMQICKALQLKFAIPSLKKKHLNQNCLFDLHHSEEMCPETSQLLKITAEKWEMLCSGASSGSQM